MNRNLYTEAHKINKKEQKSLEVDRDMSIENISLSPQPESDDTRTYKISRLINRLLKKTKKVVGVYRQNKRLIKNKPSINKHFGNKISRAITDLDDVIDYMERFGQQGHFIEHSNFNNNTRKVKSKKKVKKSKKK